MPFAFFQRLRFEHPIRCVAVVLALLALPSPSLGAETDPPALRRALLNVINSERAAAGAPPLSFSPALNRAAQAQADEFGTLKSLPSSRAGTADMEQRLIEAKYQASEWFENIASSSETAQEFIERWRDEDEASFRQLADGKWMEIGIGLGHLQGMSLYTFVAAVPQSEVYRRETAGLRSLEQVRAQLHRDINQQRAEHRLAPLATNTRLDVAAQQHAADMLERGYFAHESPEHETVVGRSRHAGYSYRVIGENIAEGQLSVSEVVDAWMKSPHHRDNILNPSYTELGSGLAFGRDANGQAHVLWVQVFGRPAHSEP
jgi:uncharacterized protein YkwD